MFTAKILIIDDERPLLEEVTQNLTFAGYEVIAASTGQDGIDAAIRCVPDLIICDLMMPDVDGYGVLLEVRTRQATMNIPFVFLTARSDRESFRKGMEWGADDYLTKPFTHAELVRAIRARLDKQAGREREYQNQLAALRTSLSAEHQSSPLKSEHIALIVDEFRAPLMGLLWANSLLRTYFDSFGPERRQSMFNRIDSAGRRLMQTLDDLLFLGQVGGSTALLSMEIFDLETVCREAVSDFQDIYGDAFRIEFRAHFDCRLRGNLRLVRHLITNLISHALKYSREGGLITMVLQRQGETLVLKVRDEGVGLISADLDRLRAALHEATPGLHIEGLGIALAIVHYVVQRHAGDLSFESEAGHGTIVSITLPRNL